MTAEDPAPVSDPTAIPDPAAERPDPRARPADPAGTRPKVDPDSLLPARRSAGLEPAIEGVAEEEPSLLPEVHGGGGAVTAAQAPHAARFQFLLGALLALAVAGIAGGVVLSVGRGAPSPSVNWSPWHPTSSGTGAAQQIADHVGPEYRLPTGQQLVAVTGGPLQVAGLPLTIALRADPANANNISLIDGKGVLFRLCGLGPKCAIDQGKASIQRHLLLRREALELALYSFRYLSDVKQVVVFLPPRQGQDPSQAVFFRPNDVEFELEHPLRASLEPSAPTVAGVTRSPDASLVARVTASSLYSFTLTQSNQDASVFLVLRPFVAGASPAPAPSATAPSTASSGSSAATGAPTSTTPSQP